MPWALVVDLRNLVAPRKLQGALIPPGGQFDYQQMSGTDIVLG